MILKSGAVAAATMLVLTTPTLAEDRPLPSADEVMKVLMAQVRAEKGASDESGSRYSYCETEVEEELDRRGAVVTSTTTVTLHVPTENGEMTRVISVNGKAPPTPTPEQEQRLEAARQAARERREKQARDGAPKPAPKPAAPRPASSHVSIVDDILRLTHFTMVGREDLDGFHALHLTFEPQPDAKPDRIYDRVILASKGDLWVDEAGYHLLRAKVDAADNVHFGLILANLKDFHFDTELRPADGDPDEWLPRRFETTVKARVLWKHLRMHDVTTCDDYEPVALSNGSQVGAPASDWGDTRPAAP